MDTAGTRRGETDAQLSCELGVATGGEGSRFLMAHLDVFQLILILAPDLEDAIDATVRCTLNSYSRKIVEGSREWDVMYQKLYDEELAKR